MPAFYWRPPWGGSQAKNQSVTLERKKTVSQRRSNGMSRIEAYPEHQHGVAVEDCAVAGALEDRVPTVPAARCRGDGGTGGPVPVGTPLPPMCVRAAPGLWDGERPAGGQLRGTSISSPCCLAAKKGILCSSPCLDSHIWPCLPYKNNNMIKLDFV